MKYNSLIWILPPNYDAIKGCYTPNTFLLETLRPKIDQAAKEAGSLLEIKDGSLYNFRVAQGVKDFFSMIEDGLSKFESSLIIVSFLEEKLIIRDVYLAKLARIYTCWDTCYVNYPIDRDKKLMQDFTYVINQQECPDELVRIIQSTEVT